MNIVKHLFHISFFMLFSACSSDAQNVLTPQQFYEKIKQGSQVQLVDVRTAEEFSDGHIAGAANVDFYSADMKAQLSHLNKTEPVYIYCRSGSRSGKYSQILMSLGYSVYDLDGGILAWMNESLPLIK